MHSAYHGQRSRTNARRNNMLLYEEILGYLFNVLMNTLIFNTFSFLVNKLAM